MKIKEAVVTVRDSEAVFETETEAAAVVDVKPAGWMEVEG